MTPGIETTPSPHPLHTRIKLVCFDIDGTIMNKAHEVSPATERCFRFLKSSGIRFCLASGRPFFGVKKLIANFLFDAPCSLYAGALLIDPGSESSLYQSPLDSRQVTNLIDFCRRSQCYYELYTKDDFFTDSLQHEFSAIHAQYLGQSPSYEKNILTLTSQTIFKACLVVPIRTQVAVVTALKNNLPDCVIACSPGAAHPEIMFINITSNKKSRHDTFAALIDNLALSSDQVIAFGDGETDREFLESAGIGVAMSTATDFVKASANFVAPSVEADGVHIACEHIFGMKI